MANKSKFYASLRDISSPRQRETSHEGENIEDEIPIKEMDFNGVTPLLIPGLATADQYFDLNNTLEEDKSKTKGKKKKGKEKLKKRSKHRKSSEKEESDQNDIAELPVFVKRAAEMPEGANVSDGDDDDDRKTGDEDDPHR